MELKQNQPEFSLEENERILVIGAGGFTAKHLYIPQLHDIGVTSDKLVLVDTDEERLNTVKHDTPKTETYLDVDHALAQETEAGHQIAAIFVASSTAAHADNIRSIVNASEAGHLDLSKTKVWCEKPVTPPEVFDEMRQLAQENPELDISVGYILRFSETLTALHDYLTDNQLSVTGLAWEYGKDRTKDTRPTQGVFPDEVVHPLSVTDLVLGRVFGDAIGVDVESAVIQRWPFANPDVQSKAHTVNPDIPLDPTSDIDTNLVYSFNRDGTVTQIPVTISSSFLFESERRKVTLNVEGPQGPEMLVVDFDERKINADGSIRRVDSLTRSDGSVIYEWAGDKAAAQVSSFLRSEAGGFLADIPTSLEKEDRIQQVLSRIGRVALGETFSQ